MILFKQFFEGKKKEKTKSLYVSRPLINAEDVIEWQKKYMDCPSLTADDMHVTVAFSQDEVDWSDFKPKENELTVYVDQLVPTKLGDKGAVVLKFKSEGLKERWQEFRNGGASWDYESYQPHISITYKYEGSDEKLRDIDTFTGKLIFGPEKFTEVDMDWADKVEEK